MKNRKIVELHLHLDGSLRPETVWELAHEEGITLPHEDRELLKKDLMVDESCQTLVEYLQKFDIPILILQTKEALKRVAYELVEDLAGDGTLYAEIRVAPIQHMKGGLTGEEVTAAILQGMMEANCEFNIETRLLLCAMRHLPPKESEFLIDLAETFREKGVVGLDLAGDEAGFSSELFKEFFTKAREKGIPFTIHAGEARGPESIRSAIEMGASRLGHGIRAFEDEEVMALVKEKNICLECCPVSNRDTHTIEDFSKYPIREYLDRGLKATLNSDNRTVSHTNIENEIQFLRKNITLDEGDILTLNRNALEAAFIPAELKKSLIQRLEE